MKELILIKLGGSVITDKSKEYTAREANIKRLAKEIKSALKLSKVNVIIGHGGGSFPHTPASIYKTKQGLQNKDSVYGASLVEDAARRLNMIMIKNLLSEKVPSLTLSPSSFMVCDTKACSKSYLDPVKIALKLGFVPVVYGDVVLDRKLGFTIVSTERILSVLALEFLKEYKIRIVYVTDVDGVMDEKGEVIHHITKSNFESLKSSILGAKGKDVTGGMLHKVEEALNLAKKTGIEINIVNGMKAGRLKKAVLGGKVLGTLIS